MANKIHLLLVSLLASCSIPPKMDPNAFLTIKESGNSSGKIVKVSDESDAPVSDPSPKVQSMGKSGTVQSPATNIGKTIAPITSEMTAELKSDTSPAIYNPCPAAEACVVLPFGDSITAGNGSSDEGGYRVPLMKKILAVGKHVNFVGPNINGPTQVSGQSFSPAHAGFQGWRVEQLKGIATETLTTFKPHIILLQAGTNDVWQVFDLPNAPLRLGELMDAITNASPNALLVIAKIVPSADDPFNVNVTNYNDAISALVKTRTDLGRHIIVVDMYSAFTAIPNFKSALLSDGVHPTDAGYEIMATVWNSAVGELFK